MKDAYTCAEFTVSVLRQLGFDFREDRYYSIGDIAALLAPYQIYTGDFPTPADDAGSFFDAQPLHRACYLSARNFFTLVRRKIRV